MNGYRLSAFLLRLFLFAACLPTARLAAEPEQLESPQETRVINSLSGQDPVYKEYEKEAEKASKSLSRRRSDFTPEFYEYTMREGDEITSIGLSPQLLISANGIASRDDARAGVHLMLPALVGGVFVAETPQNDMERLNKEGNSVPEGAQAIQVGERAMYYLPRGRFVREAWEFFLDPSFSMPLKEWKISSGFGNRKDPFSGKAEFHRGVDMAAPEGSDVLAAKAGRVLKTEENDPVFGNTVLLDHGSGKQSFYAHLSKIDVAEGDTVSRGQKIGEVGSTGMSTGPHLHFEVRSGATGAAENPAGVLRGLK
jgi:murein DD-endopeptidase MepM/ murein hydrolase activator NlpD